LACAVVLLLLPGLQAQPGFERPQPTDPSVVELEKLLGEAPSARTKEEADKHLEKLRAELKKLSSLRELEYALVLRAWVPPRREFSDNPNDPKPPEFGLVVLRQALQECSDKYATKWVEVLKTDDATKRRAALTLLAAKGSVTEAYGLRSALAHLASPLLDSVEGKKVDEVVAVLRTVGQLPASSKGSLPKLGALLKDHKENAVRVAAAAAIGKAAETPAQFHDRENLTRLIEVNSAVIQFASVGLNDKTPEVQQASLQSIRASLTATSGRVSNELLGAWRKSVIAAIPDVAKLLASNEKSVALEAARALEAVGKVEMPHHDRPGQPPEANEVKTALVKVAPELGKALSHKDTEVQLHSLYALERLGVDASPALAEVCGACEATDLYVRWAAVRVLGRLAARPSDKGVSTLVSRLKDDNADVRATAVLALGMYGEKAKEAVPSLGKLTADKDAALRLLALEALTRIGKEAVGAEAELLDCLTAKDEKVRVRAMRAIVKFEAVSEKTRTALNKALDDDNLEVRQLASELLLRETLK